MTVRRPDLLQKVFKRYLIPMIILSVATSLSEFVDGIIVSAMLGKDALALVNLGMPLMLVYNVVSMMIGIGGSAGYARLLGGHERDKADKVLSVAFIALGAFSVIATAAGCLSSDWLARSMTRDEELVKSLAPYIRVISLGAFPYIMVNGASFFLTAAGKPKQSSILLIVANGVNVLLDYVYIRFLNMDVCGAAWATTTGYCFSLILMAAFLYTGKLPIRFVRVKGADFSGLVTMCGIGAAAAIGQLGLAAKMYCMNRLAQSYGGTNGIVAFTLCIQILSITSVFLSGIGQCVMPILSTLKGEGDNKGIKLIMDYAVKCLLIFDIFLAALIEAFPQLITGMYSIPVSDATTFVYRCIRIFAITILIRPLVLLFMDYYSAADYKRQASVISIIDSFAVIPFAAGLCGIIGLDGVWVSFPAIAVICLVYIALYAAMHNRGTNAKHHGLLMLERENPEGNVWSVTIESSAAEAVDISQKIAEFASGHGCGHRLVYGIELLAEEMLEYIVENSPGNTLIDVMIKICDDKIHMYFRSDGEPLNAFNAITQMGEDSDISRRQMLRLFADDVEYERVLGMNSTIIVKRKGP